MFPSADVNGHITVGVTEPNIETMKTKYNDYFHKKLTNVICSDDSYPAQLSVESAPTRADFSPRIVVTFHNIKKVIDVPAKIIDSTSKKRIIQRTLLDNVSGQVHPGQIVALMGPSGCGKTTLLNTLSGRALNGVTGNIWFNNQRYDKSMKRKLAYVLQQDLFFENLTVKQQLTYTALLRLPSHLSRKEKIAQVEQIIDQLSIRNCANTPIMLISGGEKKRVNIGTEFLTNPSVLLLDEPTSGLDSSSAAALLDILRGFAAQGKTIITSIHQPSSQIFHSFDQLILLADGKTIFMGKPSNALAYFETLGHHSPLQCNPADFILDLVNSNLNIRQELKQFYIQNQLSLNNKNFPGRKFLIAEPSGNEADLPNLNLTPEKKDQRKWPISFFAQFIVLSSRNLIIASKTQFSVLNCIQTLSLAIICGLCWLRMNFDEHSIPDRSSFIFFMVTFSPYEILLNSLMSFPLERAIIDRERASGSFRLSAYFLAKSLSEAPLKLVLPTFFLIISYWMANISSNFFIFLAILAFQLMTLLVAESFGLLLGAACQHLEQALVTANVILIASFLLGGFFVRTLPYWFNVWSRWFSFFKYSYDACLQLQFMTERLFQCIDGSYIDVCHQNINGTFTGDDAIRYFHVNLNVGFNFLVLFGMFLAFRFLAYLALRFINNQHGRT